MVYITKTPKYNEMIDWFYLKPRFQSWDVQWGIKANQIRIFFIFLQTFLHYLANFVVVRTGEDSNFNDYLRFLEISATKCES